ncbi:winged helix-turn-helix domain-containing protein [Acinetobacter sp. WCHAc010034]|uniref:winged helix-turn-helix domain-containing protein n=1 Tax=Acinetobacter sp. WCHAc010034 TaxID=1879049 RepID=UPI000839FCDC|nr:crosslink repair DNA glycosylase YcaQ family protein [Acinetobacter sp. WCHAc010034]AYA02445.1 winged helix-turn-helix domain-containing protein [Acinetobacter sp. WCHAc010034]
MIKLLKNLTLFRQGLGAPGLYGKGISGTLQVIEHLGYVQIDTISVVERAHHHILWSRVPDYDLIYLNTLIREKQIFEHWHHAASYLPMRDYRYTIPFMASVRNGENRYFNRGDKHLMHEILARINAEGKIRLRDLDKVNNENQRNWWNSGPNRRAFEQLFMQGDLMVCERHGMEKVYDLTERCLPENIDLSTPTLQEYALYLFDATLRAHGVFTWKQLLHLKGGKDLREAMRNILNERLSAGMIEALKMPDGQAVYIDMANLERELKYQTNLKILSPFDNLVIHRDRLNTLFEFDYRMECYVPASKRVYGYFCLPILYRGGLVGRIDCKAYRAEKRLAVLNLHLDDSKIQDKNLFLLELNIELQRFAEFNQCLYFEGLAA